MKCKKCTCDPCKCDDFYQYEKKLDREAESRRNQRGSSTVHVTTDNSMKRPIAQSFSGPGCRVMTIPEQITSIENGTHSPLKKRWEILKLQLGIKPSGK